jgi:hypothetical protein
MVKVWRSTTIIKLEENEQGKITQTRTMLEVVIHSTKYLQNIEFPDRTSAKDNKINCIKRKANSMKAG